MESMNYNVELGDTGYTIGIYVEQIEERHYAVMQRYILALYASIKDVSAMLNNTNIDDMIDGIFNKGNDSE